MVPGNRGCGLAVLAAMAMLAPSFAARSAIAKLIPRLPPVINRVRPRKLLCSTLNHLSLINFFTFTSFPLLGLSAMLPRPRVRRDTPPRCTAHPGDKKQEPTVPNCVGCVCGHRGYLLQGLSLWFARRLMPRA